uniref:Uncharacterized protein n=1 Tax=Timema bartmani TaxID=61472 RepID=A0A7R9EWW7_9NEOP|nr:unnamed protein product [Timema bartmani]
MGQFHMRNWPIPFNFSFGKRTGGSARRPNECFVLEPSEMIVTVVIPLLPREVRDLKRWLEDDGDRRCVNSALVNVLARYGNTAVREWRADVSDLHALMGLRCFDADRFVGAI